MLPLITTDTPGPAEAGEIPVIAGCVTLNATPLLATLFTVTTTLPVVAPDGTGTLMLVALQVFTVAARPLNFTVLAPSVAPKFAPVIVTRVPTAPEAGEMLLIDADTVNVTPLLG